MITGLLRYVSWTLANAKHPSVDIYRQSWCKAMISPLREIRRWTSPSLLIIDSNVTKMETANPCVSTFARNRPCSPGRRKENTRWNFPFHSLKSLLQLQVSCPVINPQSEPSTSHPRDLDQQRKEVLKKPSHGYSSSQFLLQEPGDFKRPIWVGLPRWLGSKESACQCRDTGSIPGCGRSPGKVNSNPLQYSCLGNHMDRGTWWATVHRVTKTWTWLKRLSTCIYMCVFIYTHKHILFCIFHYGLSQDIEYSSLCYTVGPVLSRDSYFWCVVCCCGIEMQFIYWSCCCRSFCISLKICIKYTQQG